MAERKVKLYYADALSIFIKIRGEKRAYSTRIEWPTTEVMLADIKKGNEERKTEKKQTKTKSIWLRHYSSGLIYVDLYIPSTRVDLLCS